MFNSRTEGMGFNATCRVHGIGKHTLRAWEKKFGELKTTPKLYALTHNFFTQII